LGGTLFVEEGYHMKGGIRDTDHSLIMSEGLDIREVIDDAVDVVIEKVLEKGGNVVFLESGALTNFQRIALIVGG
jgi:inosine-uridine nucleoside N-ribohydrolase